MKAATKTAGCNPRCDCADAVGKELERHEKLEHRLVSKLCKTCRWCYGDGAHCEECWVKDHKRKKGWRA